MFNIAKHHIKRQYISILAFYAGLVCTSAFGSGVDQRRIIVLDQPRAVIIEAIYESHREDTKWHPTVELAYKRLEAAQIQNPQLVELIEIGQELKHTYKLENPNGWNKAPTKITYYLFSKKGPDLANWLDTFIPPRTFAENYLSRLNVLVNKIVVNRANTVNAAEVAIPTPLQLRVIQSRRFMKPVAEVTEAISNYFKDSSGFCHLTNPRVTHNGIKHHRQDDVIKLVVDSYTVHKGGGQCFFASNPGTRYIFELDIPEPKQQPGTPFWFDPDINSGKSNLYPNTEATVRVRISENNNPVYASESYKSIFKKIGDQLFLDAIEIQPITAE